MWNETETKQISLLFQTPAHVKRNWNKTLKQLWNVSDLFQSCFRPRLRWLFQRFVWHVRSAETKQCRRWSAEIKQICFSLCFSFISHVRAAFEIDESVLFKLDVLPVAQPTASKHWRKNVFFYKYERPSKKKTIIILFTTTQLLQNHNPDQPNLLLTTNRFSPSYFTSLVQLCFDIIHNKRICYVMLCYWKQNLPLEISSKVALGSHFKSVLFSWHYSSAIISLKKIFPQTEVCCTGAHPLWGTEPARVKPNYHALLTGSAFNQLGQSTNSPGNRAYCYAELAVSSLAVAVTIASTHYAYPLRDSQAVLAWVAWCLGGLVRYQNSTPANGHISQY